MAPEDLIAKWKEASLRDDVTDKMVPSDVRELVFKLEQTTAALKEIAASGEDGTSGDGHQRCREIAWTALD